jgi:sialate O-acetylesterase
MVEDVEDAHEGEASRSIQRDPSAFVERRDGPALPAVARSGKTSCMRALLAALPLCIPLAAQASPPQSAPQSRVEPQVRLDPLFTDGAVLQRDLPVRVAGHAPPGASVHVSIAGADAPARADADGRFAVFLAPLPAGGPFTLAVRAEGAMPVELREILVGEVWLCSGQSNMEWPMRAQKDAPDAWQSARDPELRLFRVPRRAVLEPATDCAARWEPCTPESAKEFSAVAHAFGSALRARLGVPVGLVESAFGGTRAEAWTRPPALAGNPVLEPILAHWRQVAERWPDARREHERALAEWTAKSNGGGEATPRPRPPVAPDSQHAPGTLFFGMVAPLTRFTFRGVIWYQGESNAQRAEQYATLFPAMIRDWRDAFGQGDLPFLFVQLANFRPGEPQVAWAELRDAQRRTLGALPNTAMAVAIDLGEAGDIHPGRKGEIGRRLSLAARALCYGERELVWSGPLYSHLRVEGPRAVVWFDHAGGGLVAAGAAGALRGFEVAGADREFVPADAVIDGRTVVVSSDAIAAPVAVRYSWAADPDGNLTNVEGLPASPFRTDGWPGVTARKVVPE